MEKQFWLDKWQVNDIPFHMQETTQDLIDYIPLLNLNKGDYIFVPLCGKSRDMIWLADKGFNVIGSELSHIACDDFFAELKVSPAITKGSNHIKYELNNIQIFCGDMFHLTSSDLPTIHAVYDCKALIALPPDVRKKYVAHIASNLGSAIKILLLTRESNCQVDPPPYSVDSAEVNALYGQYYSHVDQVKHVTIRDIPPRLAAKGYTEMSEGVYIISNGDHHGSLIRSS